MINLDQISFEEMGFQAGLEVHYQIRANRKLFCHCKPEMINSKTKPDYIFERFFRPVLGEMGDFDEGMLIEYEKGYRVIYHAFNAVNCLYEQDEQPPFEIDMNTVYSGYELAHWLNFTALVDEVIVARKQYLDGSITTGFQRTMIVARDGWVEVNGNRVRITNLTVEEDSARKIKTENFGRTVYYNLDRLGTPLVEVITDHRDCDNPTDLRKIAETIGLNMRLSGIGKRGIGVARQDVNLSITGGDRVEIKGVQNLSTFDNMCRREVVRQEMLINIAKTLNELDLKIDEIEHTYYDFSDDFETDSSDYVVMGIKLPKFGDVISLEIQPGRDLGQDIFEKASLISGIQIENMFHSGELGDCQRKSSGLSNFFFDSIDENMDKNIRDILKIYKDDSYILARGPQNWVIHAMKKIVERAKMAIDGVPQETRRLLPDGNTEFLRVIHGKQRLYPDTDSPPISIDMKHVIKLKDNVELRSWELEKEFDMLTFDQLNNLIRHDNLSLFRILIMEHGFDSKRVYTMIEEVLVQLRRGGLDIAKINTDQIIELLSSERDGDFHINELAKIISSIILESKSISEILSDRKKVDNELLEEIYQSVLDDDNQISKKFITRKIIKEIPAEYSISGRQIYDFVSKRMR